MKVRTRFAPSPTGYMHIGNLRTALYAYLYARKNNGVFVLRIEDTDRERYVEGATEIIYRTLKIAGIEYDEGPLKDGGYGPYIQSERKADYIKYAEMLVEKGAAYYCFCTKERLDTLSDTKGVRKYDKHCLKSLSLEEARRKIAKGEPYVIRQNIPESGKTSYTDMVFGEINVDTEELEDNVLIKSDGMPTYNFANVIDDHLMAINTVIRGAEYLSSTPKYNLLYDAFGWQRPVYIHLPHIMKDRERKLSKRYGDANFDDFLVKGYLPAAIVNYIALLGWSPKDNREKLNMREMIELFDVSGISKSSSIFDENKMKWLNSEYLRELTVENFNSYALPFYQKSVISGKYDYMKLSALLKNRVEILSDINDKVKFLEEFGNYDIELFNHRKSKTDKDIAKSVIIGALDVFNRLDDWSIQSVDGALAGIQEKLNLNKAQVMWSVRIAVTGSAVTPGGALEMVDLLGKERTLKRLEHSLNLID